MCAEAAFLSVSWESILVSVDAFQTTVLPIHCSLCVKFLFPKNVSSPYYSVSNWWLLRFHGKSPVSSWAGLNLSASQCQLQVSMVSPVSSPGLGAFQYLISQALIMKQNFRKIPVNYMKCLELKQKIWEI